MPGSRGTQLHCRHSLGHLRGPGAGRPTVQKAPPLLHTESKPLLANPHRQLRLLLHASSRHPPQAAPPSCCTHTEHLPLATLYRQLRLCCTRTHLPRHPPGSSAPVAHTASSSPIPPQAALLSCCTQRASSTRWQTSCSGRRTLTLASTMVHTLNTILLTSTELFQLRNQLKDLKTPVLLTRWPSQLPSTQTRARRASLPLVPRDWRGGDKMRPEAPVQCQIRVPWVGCM